ncbi:MAG: hypothetical protein KDD34_09460, partial [Bdellovibrionales bacterium]|nr:hypothetical protein [Bdellovibrionales bacterium]
MSNKNKRAILKQLTKDRLKFKIIATLLCISLAFNGYFIFEWVQKKQGGSLSQMGPGEKVPNFLKLNVPVSCENNQIEQQQLPHCPKGERLTLLPRFYPIHSLFIGYEKGIDQTGLFQTTLNLVNNMKPRIPLMVMVPRQQMEQAVAELDPYLNDKNKDLVRLLYTPSQYTVWAQDYFKPAIDVKTGKLNIFDLPYDNNYGEHIPTAIALACNANLIGQASIAGKGDAVPSGNFGGNIEPLTDGLVVIGDSMSESQKKILRSELNQKLIEI